MKKIYKHHFRIVTMLVLTMVLQIVAPMASGSVFADKAISEDFQFNEIVVEEGKATIAWNLNLKTDNTAKVYTKKFDFVLAESVEDELKSDNNIVVGNYTISTEGEVTVNIDEKLYESYEDYTETTTQNGIELPEESIGKEFQGKIQVEGLIEKPSPIDMMGSSGIELEVPNTVIHTVIAKDEANGTLIQDIQDYRPKIGDELWLEIQFALEANHPYGDGSELTYELPTPLKAASGSGSLSQGDTEYANFTVADGKVVITFNENVRQYDTGIEIQKGYFGITAKFESSSTELEQELVLPGKDTGEITIPINFQPIGGTELKKAVTPTKGKNIKELTWTVNVNEVMNDLGTDGKEFKDKLQNTSQGKHQYKQDSLQVKRYKLGNDGVTRILEEDVTSDFNQLLGTEEEFSLLLKDKYAYEITYITIPEDTEESSQTLKNKAEFPGVGPVVKSARITYGKPLEKKGEAISPRGTTKWEIIVNANEKTIAPGTSMTDTWSAGHKLKDGTFKINGDTTLPTGFVVGHESTGFVLTLPEVTEEFTITYETELVDPNGVIFSDITITNEVVRSDRTDIESDRKKTISYGQEVLAKTNSGPNYQEKTVDWTITINSAKYNMKDIVLTDSFANRNLKIKDGTFLVKKGNSTLDPSNYTLKYGVVDGSNVFTEGTSDDKGGFQLTIPNTENSADKYTITYTTYYDIKNVDDPTSPVYKNTAGVKWDTNGKEYTSSQVSSTVEINPQQKKNGYKEGKYNYEEKKFYWDVGINYNFDTIEKPIFTDTLSSLQIVDRSSIKLYNLDLTSGGNGHITGDPLVEGTDYTLTAPPLANTFTITFLNQIATPYRIRYTSTTKHDYYAPSTENHKVVNNAILKNGPNKRGEWSTTVEVEHSKKLITKTPKQDGGSSGSGSALVHWTLNLNWSQSKLKMPVIKDSVGKDSAGNLNQMIYKDSFKITEMNFVGDNKTPVKGQSHDPGGDLYDISFSEGTTDPTFTITFKKDINKAYILEYDSYFLGANNADIKNTATLSYKYNSDDGNKENTSEEAYSATFKYFGGASAEKGQIQITKEDEDDHEKKLSGAVFQLWNRKENGILIEEVSEDVDGVYTFNTKLGYANYYLIEKIAPEFYDISSSEYKDRKKVQLDTSLKTLTISNKKFKQAIEVSKVAKHDQDLKLEGVEFELKKKDGSGNYNLVPGYEKLITNASGEIYIDDLIAGDYQLIEIKALPFYKLESAPIEFKITQGQKESIKKTVQNTKQGNVTVKKTDQADNNPLEGAVFTLTNISNPSHQYTSTTTGTDGIAKFTNVEYGKYKLTETVAPSGYVAGSEIEITIGDSVNTLINPQAIAARVENEKIYQAVKLSKVDQEDNSIGLTEAEFELYNKDTDIKITTNEKGEALGELKTDANGNISINNLAPGNYYFKEIVAPKYYMLPTDQIDFTIIKDQTTITEVIATNKRGKGSIEITKMDDTKNDVLLKGVQFTLYDQAGTALEIEETDQTGSVSFANLAYGIYTIVETKALDSYVPNTQPIEVELISTTNTDGEIKYIDVTNTKKDHSVTLTKYNLNKTLKLAGAVFELRRKTDISGEYELITRYSVDELSTGTDGIINLKDLDVGKYQLVEVRSPVGYVLDRTPVEFEITENQTASKEVEKVNRRRSSGGGGGRDPEDPDPEEPIDPDDPEDPDPTKPVDPDDPEDPDPTDSTDPVDPDDPGPTDPTDPEDPDDPQPVDPTDPTDPTDPPRYRPSETPDPNDPNSPDEIIIVDENGVPQGTYKKKENPDGSFIYIDENGVPLGTVLEDGVPAGGVDAVSAPKTGDDLPVLPLAIVFIISLLSAMGLMIFKRKRYN